MRLRVSGSLADLRLLGDLTSSRTFLDLDFETHPLGNAGAASSLERVDVQKGLGSV